MRKIYRYTVPIDDKWHTFRLWGPPLTANVNVAGAAIDFWAEWHDAGASTEHSFRIFGTGHKLPDDAKYVSTAPRTPNGFVWHLYEQVDYVVPDHLVPRGIHERRQHVEAGER